MSRWGPRHETTFAEAEEDLVKRSDMVTHWTRSIALGAGVKTEYGVFYPSERGVRYARKRLAERQKLERAFVLGEDVILNRGGVEVLTKVRVAPWSYGDEWLIGVLCEPRIVRLEAVRSVKAEADKKEGKAA